MDALQSGSKDPRLGAATCYDLRAGECASQVLNREGFAGDDLLCLQDHRDTAELIGCEPYRRSMLVNCQNSVVTEREAEWVLRRAGPESVR